MVKKYTFIAGHGKQPNGRTDSGATGNGETEAGFIRDKLFTAMKKYAGSDVEFVTSKDVYAYGNLKDYKGSVVTEVHLDSFNSKASGGHVIVNAAYSPDSVDLKLRDVIKKWFGVRYTHKGQVGISGRTDLANINRSKTHNINYRLLEVCFISNPKEMNTLKNNLDAIARDIVQAVTGSVKTPVASNNVYKVKNGDTLWGIAQRHSTTVLKLKTLNNIKSDVINIGQKIKTK